jgi:hypothetical protein
VHCPTGLVFVTGMQWKNSQLNITSSAFSPSQATHGDRGKSPTPASGNKQGWTLKLCPFHLQNSPQQIFTTGLEHDQSLGFPGIHVGERPEEQTSTPNQKSRHEVTAGETTGFLPAQSGELASLPVSPLLFVSYLHGRWPPPWRTWCPKLACAPSGIACFHLPKQKRLE